MQVNTAVYFVYLGENYAVKMYDHFSNELQYLLTAIKIRPVYVI